MKKKVLLFADPTSIHTKKWKEGLELIGYEANISGITNEIKNEFLIDGYISPFGGNATKYLKNIFKFKKILDKYNPDIINGHYLTSYGLIAALLKKKNQFLIMSVHGSDIMINMDKNLVFLKISKYIFNKSNLIVSVSQLMTNKILKYFPELKDKIITQQYGVNIDFLNKIKNKKVNKDLIITNRHWKPNSNYDILVDVLLKYNNVKLIAYNDSEYAKNILKNYHNYKDKIEGLLSYDENLKYVNKSKIFISLTSSDGVPLSVVEAMYLGAIPIVSDIPSNRELIQDGVNGFLVDIDKKALKEKIDYVLNLDENILNNIRENNKKLVLEKFDFKKNFLILKKYIEKGFK